MEKFWQSCLSQLESELTPQQYSAWIKPLVPLDYKDGILRVAAPNRFKLDWVKTQYADRITSLACQFLESTVDVQFMLNPGTRSASPSKPAPSQPKPEPVMPSETAETSQRSHVSDTPTREQSRINVEMTFDSFVTGKANQLARAAAIQVANNPGVSYNPLYLFGGVGLGKTHLIQCHRQSGSCRHTFGQNPLYPRRTVRQGCRSPPISARGSTTSSVTTIHWTCF